MHDYQPLDLSQFCNVGTEFIKEGAQPLIGSQMWHGLPFTVGTTNPDPARCLIGFASGEEIDVTVRFVLQLLVILVPVLLSNGRLET